MTLAFLFARAPDQRDVTRFEIQALVAERKVLLLDLSEALGRGGPAAPPIHLPPHAELHSVGSPVHFEQVVKDSEVELVIDLLPRGRRRSILLSICRSADLTIVRHAIGPVPPLPRPPVRMLVLERIPRPGRRWVNLLDSHAGRLWPDYETPVHAFISAGDASLASDIARNASNVISGRSLDCDENERVVNLPGLPSRFSVFVDSGGPLHPDFKLLGVRSSSSARSYFDEVRDFLNAAQEVLGMPVLIARHPRMSEYSYSDVLPDFSVFDSSTSELVRRSEMVFDCGSTATSFSVLNAKPIRFIAPGARRGNHLWRLAHAFSAALGLNVYEDCERFARSLLNNEELPTDTYANYRRKYLFSDDHTGHSFSQEILSLASKH